MDKTAVIIALALLAVIIVFIVATCVAFAPRSVSGLDGLLNAQTQKGPSVTVSYDLGGGSPSMASEEFKNGVVELPYCSAKRKGYKFDGWAYDGKVYGSYDKIKGITTSSITVTATWKPITYTIKFYSLYGSGHMSDIKAEYGQKIKLPKSNYLFMDEPLHYWYIDLFERYDDEDTVINLSDMDGGIVTLLASWNEINIFVTLDGNDGYGGEDRISFYTDDIPTVENFGWKKDGYVFVGWKCGDKMFYKGEAFDFGTYRYSEYTVKAVWEYVGNYYDRNSQ